MSPMMEQYLATKQEYNDCILFYRLGDFYEVFFDDALLVSKLCELVLTSKACGNKEKAPMCGVPFHALDSYLAQLVGAGYKVAIAEQMEDPATITKGLVPRDVIRIVTPGTITSSGVLSEKYNNYIVALYLNGAGETAAEASWCDLSTGEFNSRAFEGDGVQEEMLDMLALISPREIITNSTRDDAAWLWEYAELSEVFISTINKRLTYEGNAPSLLMAYLRDTQKQDISHLGRLHVISDTSRMRLDRSTLRNLELTETIFGKNPAGSLAGVLDKCKTAMGSRKLKQWVKEPLTDKELIEGRLNAVEALVAEPMTRNNLRAFMTGVYDLERLISRLSLGRTSVKDLLALKQSLAVLPDVKAELEMFEDDYLRRIDSQIDDLQDIHNLIEKSIEDDPDVQKERIIKPGFSTELDDIRESARESFDWLDNLEKSEKARTGIRNLKTGRNRVFGYYIEVTNSQLHLVPDDYIRKQTTKTGERYITQELKEVENIVLNVQGRIDDLEKKLFNGIQENIQVRTKAVQQTALGLSVLDVICSFAEVSSKNGYVKPHVSDGDSISVHLGRHPVVEQSPVHSGFVPNDAYIDREGSSLLLITGPNMSGKSTYMRQLALIVIMAQMGCFVPAKSADIGICDRIYTRIGSADNISMGQSTFYVEMAELANILNTATSRSLVVLDEIGRGTSTFDGLSIAWSTVEFLADARIRTMFATHYHELTSIGVDGVRNLNVEVDERDDTIEFTYRIAEGPASQSYGIQVAKLAGVPNSVLARAREVLESLESDERG